MRKNNTEIFLKKREIELNGVRDTARDSERCKSFATLYTYR
jgi:hypothetical protein